MRTRTLLTALAVALPFLTVLGPVAPAHAAPTSFTWTGVQSSSWGNPQNWMPSDRAPENGDSVTIGVSGRNPTDVPDITLAMLTVNGSPDSLVSLSGEGHVFAQQLQWTGGDINVDLTVGGLGAPPSFIRQTTNMMRFGGGGDQVLDVVGDLSFLLDPFAGTTGPWVEFMFDSSLRVASTGIVRLDPQTWLRANRCCTNDTSTVVVDGTLEVFSITGATGYTAKLDNFGLDHAGLVDVAAGNTLQLVGGPVRVGGDPINGTVGDASVAGGGVLDIASTSGDNFDPANAKLPDGTLKFLDDGETVSLAEDSVLQLGDATEVSGVGTITGDGSVRLAGPDLRGDLTLDVPATTIAGTLTRIVHYDDDRGQSGVLRPDGGLRIVPTSELRVHGSTTLTVPTGSRVTLAGGATIDSDGCCLDPGRIVTAPGGTFAIGGSTADPARIESVVVGGAGAVTHTGRTEWDPAGTSFGAGSTITGTGTVVGDLSTGSARVVPVGLLTIDGDWKPGTGGTYAPTLPASRTATSAPSRLRVTDTASLAGVLTVRGDTDFATGHQVLALDAGTVSGRFRCVTTPGQLPSYAATTVTLRSIGLDVAGCVTPSSGRVLKAAFQGRRQASLGVPTGTDKVLLQVSLGKAPRANTLRLSAGGSAVTLKAKARKGASRLVVLPTSAARRLTATTTRRAGVTVTRVGYVG